MPLPVLQTRPLSTISWSAALRILGDRPRQCEEGFGKDSQLAPFEKPNSIVYRDLVVELLRCNPHQSHDSFHKDLRADIATVMSRFGTEGLSFLTKTLPKLGKALDKGLEESLFSRPREFKSSTKDDCRPAFMRVYFNRVFDENGKLLDDADPVAVSHVRQVCFFGYKVELPYKATEEARVISEFIRTEEELDFTLDTDGEATMAAASYILRDVFRDFDHKDIVPRHGPGAVSTGERLEEKWEFSRLYNSIHQVYPYYQYMVVGGAREVEDRLEWYKSMQRLETGVAKVVLVPKDSRGPRLISCEPLEFQWIQQGLGRKMVGHLESHRMTGGQINFTDQMINRRIALSSSWKRTYATLDLKEASDRVSVRLVSGLFKECPDLLRALLACRTSSTKLPDGSILPLKKYAPMGSSLCFPVMATTVWALTVAFLCRKLDARPEEVGRMVFVYGDDIIVPTKLARDCIQSLERFGLKVNRSKCCIDGYFRESCGMDAFKGIDVTPVRLHTPWTGRKSDGGCLASWVETANALSKLGYHDCSAKMFELVEGVYGKLPYVLETSPTIGRIASSLCDVIQQNAGRFRMKRDAQLHSVKIHGLYAQSGRVPSELDGWQRMLRNVVSGQTTDPSTVVLPRSMKIKRGWKAL